MKVRNMVTQEVGTLRGAWKNAGGQVILNVRPEGQHSGFVMWKAANVEKTAA